MSWHACIGSSNISKRRVTLPFYTLAVSTLWFNQCFLPNCRPNFSNSMTVEFSMGNYHLSVCAEQNINVKYHLCFFCCSV